MADIFSDSQDIFVKEMEKIDILVPQKIDVNPDNIEKGLAKLVLTVLELIRQLMERQGMKRIDGGSLTDDEIERLGETFMKLEDKMEELKKVFGLADKDLNLDLGPIGKLM